MTKSKKKKTKAESQRPRGGRKPDPRVTHTQVVEDAVISGMEVKKGTWLRSGGAVRLGDGRHLIFGSPQVVAFYLIEAKRALERAERRRRGALKAIQNQGMVHMATDEEAVLDALGGLTTAVLLSFAGIEALANACIEALPDGSTLTVERQDGPVAVGKERMVRSLRISEKLDLAVPMLTGDPSVKGTAAWESYVRIRRMRDSLVHVKDLGYSDDPDSPSVFGQLLRGYASTCVNDAVSVVIALRPDWLSPAARQSLGVQV